MEEVRQETAQRRKEWEDRQKEQEKSKLPKRRVIDGFPGVLIFFGRVLNLLRGLCVDLNSHQSYLDVMGVSSFLDSIIVIMNT